MPQPRSWHGQASQRLAGCLPGGKAVLGLRPKDSWLADRSHSPPEKGGAYCRACRMVGKKRHTSDVFCKRGERLVAAVCKFHVSYRKHCERCPGMVAQLRPNPVNDGAFAGPPGTGIEVMEDDGHWAPLCEPLEFPHPSVKIPGASRPEHGPIQVLPGPDGGKVNDHQPVAWRAEGLPYGGQAPRTGWPQDQNPAPSPANGFADMPGDGSLG